jgi:hypothetical protein
VEPRATPAATRGQKPCPHVTAATTKTDQKTRTEHKDRNRTAHHKRLKSLVLGYGPDPILILEAIEKDGLISSQFYDKFARLLVGAHVRNAPKLIFRVRCYQVGILLLIVEVGTMIFAIATR